ncbi:hypothetical protein [Streptomyces sp. NBC_00272]|uniref:hypothetical protein n=1 Tax=Streptomyces sp. NBC_00272 TaxID=2975698 RepID=UPI002E27C360|nr:hypothetical protein [Streptomyces sp. NBC_00272]
MAASRSKTIAYADAAHRALDEQNAPELATALLKAAIAYSGHRGRGEAADASDVPDAPTTTA